MNLDSWVLRVNLPLDETLQRSWRPDIKADLAVNRGDFKANMLLLPAR